MEEMVFAALGGFIFVIIGITIAIYVLTALGLMRLAQNRGIENPWLAWVPFGNLFILGKIAGDEIVVFNNLITNLSLVLLIGSAVSPFISAIPLLGQLAMVAFIVLVYMVYYKVFMEIKPESATLYLVLSILIPGAMAIILFILSKNDNYNEGQY